MSETSTLTMAEVRQAKLELETLIRSGLEWFTEKTGVKIEDVDVTTVETVDGRTKGYIVEIDAKL